MARVGGSRILVRFLLYLADTYSRYIARNDLKIYGSKKVSLPVPELYVIYHGDRGNKPDEILLSRDSISLSPLPGCLTDASGNST